MKTHFTRSGTISVVFSLMLIVVAAGCKNRTPNSVVILTPTRSATVTATRTAFIPTATATYTYTVTDTFTVTNTLTATYSVTETLTTTGTPTITETLFVSDTPTMTVTQTLIPTQFPTPQGTYSLIDNMEDGDDQTNTVDWGGTWFSFDDVGSPFNGDSSVWPMSKSAMDKYSYPTPLPTFEMTDFTVPGNSHYLRISGTVSTNAYLYGFMGCGFYLNPGKTAVDLTAAGYIKIRFMYKNGPSVTGNNRYYIMIESTAHSLSWLDDLPVKYFYATNEWQIFEYNLSSFYQMGWQGTSYPASDFLPVVTGFRFFTDYRPGTADLLIDDIYLIK